MKKRWIETNIKNRSPNFKVEFNFQEFNPTNFQKESENVCRELYDTYGNNLFLSFSGGSDSEFILKKFIEQKIPITPVIVSCPYNQEDIKSGLKYCEENNIKFEMLFYGNDFIDMANEKADNYNLGSIIGMTPLFVYDEVKKCGGKVVTGQGEPLPITERGNLTYFGSKIELFDFEFYMECYAEDQPPPFFCYNQEIFYTYMSELDCKLDLQNAKCKLYKIKDRKKTYWSNEIYDLIKERKFEIQKYVFETTRIKNQMEEFIVEKKV